jgi:F420H(2)-dependent quinone reductase
LAAGDGARWALNLLDEPRVDVEIGERVFPALAEPLDGADHARAIQGMILRYGTPAERLGRGPSFRLRPLASAAG